MRPPFTAAASTSSISRRRLLLFRPRLCFLGAPGSGKGSYGKILARHWGIPMISVSDVLKKSDASQNAIAAGQLVDDTVVNQALVDHMLSSSSVNHHSSFLLDGFPRTVQQVHLMNTTWPIELQLHGAVHLNVPLEVCERKLLGRRICKLCGNHYNIHGVTSGGFDLPPKLPRVGECHLGTTLGTPSLPQQHNLTKCDPGIDWIRRDDDQQHIIQHRLQVYEQYTKPILDYYNNNEEKEGSSSLFSFVPYRGFEDMPKFQTQLEDWLIETFPEVVLDGMED